MTSPVNPILRSWQKKKKKRGKKRVRLEIVLDRGDGGFAKQGLFYCSYLIIQITMQDLLFTEKFFYKLAIKVITTIQ